MSDLYISYDHGYGDAGRLDVFACDVCSAIVADLPKHMGAIHEEAPDV